MKVRPSWPRPPGSQRGPRSPQSQGYGHLRTSYPRSLPGRGGLQPGPLKGGWTQAQPHPTVPSRSARRGFLWEVLMGRAGRAGVGRHWLGTARPAPWRRTGSTYEAARRGPGPLGQLFPSSLAAVQCCHQSQGRHPRQMSPTPSCQSSPQGSVMCPVRARGLPLLAPGADP